MDAKVSICFRQRSVDLYFILQFTTPETLRLEDFPSANFTLHKSKDKITRRKTKDLAISAWMLDLICFFFFSALRERAKLEANKRIDGIEEMLLCNLESANRASESYFH